MGGEDTGERRAHGVTEDERVGDLHHGGLEVEGQEHVVVLGGGYLPGQEVVQGGGGHEGGVQDLPGSHRQGLAQHHWLPAVGRAQADRHGPRLRHDHAALVVAEVPGVHGGHAGAGGGGPGPHGVGVGAGVGLDCGRRAAVGVALAQDGVDGAALDGVVGGTRPVLGLGGGGVRVVGDVVALGLELGHGGPKLGQGGRDVGELDDGGLWGAGQRAQGRQVVGSQAEGRQDPPGQGDVGRVHRDAGAGQEAAYDRQEGAGRQHGRLVGQGVDDTWLVGCLRHGYSLRIRAGGLRAPVWSRQETSRSALPSWLPCAAGGRCASARPGRAAPGQPGPRVPAGTREETSRSGQAGATP